MKEKIYFASGCFWCTEAVFQQLRGVTAVASGYAGGQLDNPTYKDVCTGTGSPSSAFARATSSAA